MLKQLSKLERTRNVLILGFVGLMAVSLVLFFRPNSGSSQIEPTRSSEVLAAVGGEEITVGEFATQKQRIQQQFSQFGGQISLMQMGYTDEKILDGLILKKVAVLEARRLGLGASEGEVKERIANTFRDPTGKFLLLDASGKFDMSRYQERVGDIAMFERGVAEDIAREKLEAFITASVRISEDDVREDFKRKNTAFDLQYVVVSAIKLAEKIQPSEEELKAYYEKHKTDYNILVPQKKIRYLFIDQDKSGQKTEITDKELHDEYDSLKPEYKQAGVKAQEIVLRVARPELDETVKKKADDLVARARGTSGTSTEDAFAELAKGNSENPATAKNGGRLNSIVKKKPKKPVDLYQKELDMQPGHITDPIKLKNGFAVPMLVEKRDPRIPDFDEVKDKVIKAVKDEKAKAQLEEKAKEIIASAKTPGDLKAAAAKLGFEAKAEANYKLATPLGEAGSSTLIDDPLYAAKAGEVIQKPVFLNENYLVFGVTKRTEADLTEFAKQRDSLMQTAQTERKNQVFEDYLAVQRSRLDQAGKIKVNKDVFANFQAEEEPEAAPPRRPQLPTTK